MRELWICVEDRRVAYPEQWPFDKIPSHWQVSYNENTHLDGALGTYLG